MNKTWYCLLLFIIINLPQNQLMATSAGGEQKWVFHGQYGLYIGIKDTLVQVYWITEKADQGYLKVYYQNRPVHQETTSTSRVHKVQFESSGNGEYKLVYGELADNTSWTRTIFLLDDENKRLQTTFEKIDSVYMVGDTHGHFDNVKKLLRSNGIINEELNWIAGKKHLVFLGDLFDRGHNVTPLLWMLYRLDFQAKDAGGKVHLLLGNHEIMTFSNDLRYLSPKEASVAATYGMSYLEFYDRKQSILGRWLADKPAIIKIGNMLLAHGGVTPYYADYTLKAFDDSLKKFMKHPFFGNLGNENYLINSNENLRWKLKDFFYSSTSPFWFRGYVQSDTLERQLDYVLDRFGAKTHVVGHTGVETIERLYEGKLFATDLRDKASEILLFVRKKGKYEAFKFDIEGVKIP